MDKELNKINDAIKGVAENVENFKNDVQSVKSEVAVKTSEIKNLNEIVKKQQDALENALTAIQKSGMKGDLKERAELEVKYENAFKGLIIGKNSMIGVKGLQDEYKSALEEVAQKAGDFETVERVKAISTNDFTNGGALVPVTIANEIVKKQRDFSNVRQLASVRTSDIGGLILPVEIADMDAGWVGENQTRAENDAGTIGTVEISVNEQAAKIYITNRMMQNKSFDIMGYVAEKAASRLSRLEGNAFMLGDGHKKPHGMLAYDAGTGTGQVEQKTTLNSTSITHKDLANLKAGLKGVYRNNARYLFNSYTEAYLENLEDGNGRPLLNNGDFSRDIGPRIKNFPYAIMDDMAGASSTDLSLTANDLVMIFGDIAQFYTIVDHTTSMTMLVNPYKVSGTTVLEFSKFVGGGVVDNSAARILKVKA